MDGQTLQSAILNLPGLAAYWPLDDGNGAIAHDLGPNDLPLTLTGIEWQTIDGYTAPYFDGVNDYGQRPGDDEALSIGAYWSAVVLVRPQAWGGDVFSKYALNNLEYLVYVLNTGVAAWRTGTDGVASTIMTTPNGVLSLNEWAVIGVVRNAADLKIYVNGIEKASEAASPSYYNGTAPFRVGVTSVDGVSYDEFLEGHMAHLAIGAADWSGHMVHIAELAGVTG
jgi:hypothetical protein